MRELIDLKADGSFKLNLDYFDFCAGLRMTNKRFEKLFGGVDAKLRDRVLKARFEKLVRVDAIHSVLSNCACVSFLVWYVQKGGGHAQTGNCRCGDYADRRAAGNPSFRGVAI